MRRNVRIELARDEGEVLPSAGAIVLTTEDDEHSKPRGGFQRRSIRMFTGSLLFVSSAVVRIYNSEYGHCLCVDEAHEAQGQWRMS